jgi:transcriptional regulator with XRE-family HTH domain
MNVGDNLRILRGKRNISQQKIADFVCVNRKTYERWESGETDVKSEHIIKLAEFFGVEIADLFPKKAGDTVINQHDFNSDNKEGSINAGIFFLTDKEMLDQIVDVMKKRFKVQ